MLHFGIVEFLKSGLSEAADYFYSNLYDFSVRKEVFLVSTIRQSEVRL